VDKQQFQLLSREEQVNAREEQIGLRKEQEPTCSVSEIGGFPGFWSQKSVQFTFTDQIAFNIQLGTPTRVGLAISSLKISKKVLTRSSLSVFASKAPLRKREREGRFVERQVIICGLPDSS
jgi:hypothetical protein